MTSKRFWPNSRLRAAIALVCLLPLSISCSPSVPSSQAVRAVLQNPLAQPPAAFTNDCAPPVTLPDTDLGSAQVATMWGADRAALADCGSRHSALVQFYIGRDKALAGQ